MLSVKYVVLVMWDIRRQLTRVGDAEARHTVEFTARGTELDVVASEVVDTGLGKHSVVLDLGLTERRAVVADDNKLGLATAKRLQHGLEAQGVLSGLHDQGEPGVDVFGILLALSFGNHL